MEKSRVKYEVPELVEYGYFAKSAFGAGASGQAGPGEDMPEDDGCMGVAALQSGE